MFDFSRTERLCKLCCLIDWRVFTCDTAFRFPGCKLLSSGCHDMPEPKREVQFKILQKGQSGMELAPSGIFECIIARIFAEAMEKPLDNDAAEASRSVSKFGVRLLISKCFKGLHNEVHYWGFIARMNLDA